MQAHPEIASWLKDRPFNTQRVFAEKLTAFSEAMKVTPEKWRRLDKFKARDLAWKYVEPLKGSESAKAILSIAALKSWYRNLNGETLPLDSNRGGKHNIKLQHKRALYEHIPNKEEVYRIVDMAGNLRDKAVLLTLFQSGMRVNALCKLTYGIVKDQLTQDIITLKITSNIDDKLRGISVPFYYTFINGEGAQTLRQFCEVFHKNSTSETPLFYTKMSRKPVNQVWILCVVKKCVQRAGLDPKTMWTHSFRKAFRKMVRQAPISDDDDKEQLMGHVLKGSRENYFDRNDLEWLKEAYKKCNFSRGISPADMQDFKMQLRMKDAEIAELKQTPQKIIESLQLIGLIDSNQAGAMCASLGIIKPLPKGMPLIDLNGVTDEGEAASRKEGKKK